MFVCLFLPTMKFCDRGATIPLVLVPPAWPPFVAGLLIALAAIAGPLHARTSALRLGALVYIVAVGYSALFVLAGRDGAIGWVGVSIAVLTAFGLIVLARWARRSQTEIAVTVLAVVLAVGTAVIGLGLGLGNPGRAALGGRVAAMASSVLLLGTLWWMAEAAWARRKP